MRIIEVLLASTAVEALSDDPPVLGSVTAFTCVQGSAATADAVVEAFMGLAEDSALEGYFLKNLVRHICGFEEEGLVVLARVACCRHSSVVSFANSQYCAVVSRMLELIENHEGSKRHDGSTAFGRGFIRDLESIAEIPRGCVCLLQLWSFRKMARKGRALSTGN
jgi:hypothetical protein